MAYVAPTNAPTPLTADITSPRSQYLFPSNFANISKITQIFNAQASISCAAASYLVCYKNGVLAQQITGTAATFNLPIVAADARTRVHWRFDMIDHDHNIGGSIFFATDVAFDVTVGTISLNVHGSPITITTTGQTIDMIPTSSLTLGMVLWSPQGTFPNNGTPDNTYLDGYTPSGNTITLTTNYTYHQNGSQTIVVNALDACGNTATFSVPITVNIPAPTLVYSNSTHFPDSGSIPGYANVFLVASNIPNGATINVIIYDGTDNTGSILGSNNGTNSNGLVNVNVYIPLPPVTSHVTYYSTYYDPNNPSSIIAQAIKTITWP